MKLVMDERLKHRLVGIAVIVSLGAIFLPAIMKKSSQRLEGNFSVNVQLPPKPLAPHVAVTDEDQMFKTIKVSKKTNLDKEDFIPAVPVAQVETAPASIEPALAAKTAVKKEIKVAANKPVKSAVKAVKAKVAVKPVIAKINKTPTIKKGIYALQLASFSKLDNAQALVSKLQHKGYKANYTQVAGRKGLIYKVFVGHSPNKNNVLKLKNQLATAMQLNGLVVNTGVS